jgi:hypothetical protein
VKLTIQPLSSAEVENAWSYTFIPPYVVMEPYLVKSRESFIFTVLNHSI